jgi:hypothetical protein
MVRCKDAKKSRTRSHALISGLDFFAGAENRRFGAACYAEFLFVASAVKAAVAIGRPK